MITRYGTPRGVMASWVTKQERRTPQHTTRWELPIVRGRTLICLLLILAMLLLFGSGISTWKPLLSRRGFGHRGGGADHSGRAAQTLRCTWPRCSWMTSPGRRSAGTAVLP